MAAKIESDFNAGFILSEENLSKIDDIIRKRLNVNGDPAHLLYKVHRVDDALITYEKFQDVISEENSKRNSIKGLEILSQPEPCAINISFEKGNKSKMGIELSDRDLALLISADLKEYLNSEILVKKLSFLTRAISSRLFMPFLFIFSMAPILIATTFANHPEPINLEKSNTEQKINYLVLMSQAKSSVESTPYLSFSPIILMLIGLAIYFVGNWIYPSDIFLWGKEVQRYNNQKSMRSKIFWSVIVAIIVSMVSAYFYDLQK